MKFKSRTHRALGIAILVWAGSMAALAVAGVATGVWYLSDLWSHGTDFLSEFGLLATLGTFLLVGGPIFLWKRYGHIAPISGLICYVAFWAVLGAGGVGVSALYVAVLYGPYALVGIAVLTMCEEGLRMVRLRWSGGVSDL